MNRLRHVVRLAFLSAACAALAACATGPTLQDLQQQAMNTPAPMLCYHAATAGGRVQQAAFFAIAARSVDCNAHAAFVAARIQHDQAQAMSQRAEMITGLQLLQAGRPQLAAPAFGAACRTYNRGGYLQTVCD
jgi:hypothetical protein